SGRAPRTARSDDCARRRTGLEPDRGAIDARPCADRSGIRAVGRPRARRRSGDRRLGDAGSRRGRHGGGGAAPRGDGSRPETRAIESLRAQMVTQGAAASSATGSAKSGAYAASSGAVSAKSGAYAAHFDAVEGRLTIAEGGRKIDADVRAARLVVPGGSAPATFPAPSVEAHVRQDRDGDPYRIDVHPVI